MNLSCESSEHGSGRLLTFLADHISDGPATRDCLAPSGEFVQPLDECGSDNITVNTNGGKQSFVTALTFTNGYKGR